MGETKRVLLIEDNPGDVGLIRAIVQEADHLPNRRFDLTSVETLAEALEVLKTQFVDVVLSDLNLPDSTGLDTLRAVTTDAPDAPVIVLTSADDEGWSTQALHVGAQDYLIKGRIDTYSLDRSIRYAMERKRAEQDRAHLLEEQTARAAAEHRAEFMRHIQFVTDATLANLRSEKLIPELLNRLRTILMADMSAILFLDERDGTLTPAGSIGLDERTPPNIHIRVGEGLAGKIAQRGTALALDDQEEIDVRYPGARERGLHSACGAPLITEGKLIGVVEVATRQRRTFTAEDQQLLQMVADRIAHAIEHVRLYQAEQTARLAAEEASHAKDQFLAVISHELRTPLTPITGWIALLRNQNRRVPMQTALDSIDRNARLLVRLIDDLLNLSAARFGTLRLQKEEIDLSALLSHVVEAATHSVIEKKIKLSVDLPSSPILIYADAERLMQAIGNVLNNAVKFTTAEGQIWIKMFHHAHRVVVQVRDTGIGIPTQFLPHIFDAFRQADTSSSRGYGGLGLGLSIAQHIVRAHGGSITAESDGLNKGSTFVFDFPQGQVPVV